MGKTVRRFVWFTLLVGLCGVFIYPPSSVAPASAAVGECKLQDESDCVFEGDDAVYCCMSAGLPVEYCAAMSLEVEDLCRRDRGCPPRYGH